MSYELGPAREIQTMEIPILAGDNAGDKIVFLFDPENIKDAKVSFDGGKTEILVSMIEDALGQFSALHPEFAAD